MGSKPWWGLGSLTFTKFDLYFVIGEDRRRYVEKSTLIQAGQP
jgi:hypothetical protein